MIERVGGTGPLDVVIKDTAPLRLAEASMTVRELAPEYIGPVFLALSPKLIDHLQGVGARPGTLVHHYDAPAPDRTVAVHVGYDIGDQSVPPAEGLEIVELPVVTVATTVHRGPIDTIVQAYESLIGWIEDGGHRRTGGSRELYHDMGADGPRVTEIQIAVAG